jgi:putative chitinase
MAAFFATTTYESNYYTELEENLNYSAKRLLEVFPKYFNEFKAEQCANNPEMIANTVYANRMGNGNELSGDGWFYRGRGIIQITGKANYERVSKLINSVTSKLIIHEPDLAVQAACAIWNDARMNRLADDDSISVITKMINGGFNGIEERKKRYNEIKEILNKS